MPILNNFKHEDFSVAASVYWRPKKRKRREGESFHRPGVDAGSGSTGSQVGGEFEATSRSRGIVELMEHWNINEDHHV